MNHLRKSLLHKSKLEDFRKWLVEQDFRDVPINYDGVVLQKYRSLPGGQVELAVVFTSPPQSEHYHLHSKSVDIVQRFIDETRKIE